MDALKTKVLWQGLPAVLIDSSTVPVTGTNEQSASRISRDPRSSKPALHPPRRSAVNTAVTTPPTTSGAQ